MSKQTGFADYFAYLLNKYQCSQRQLAKKAGLNYVTINRFVRGKQEPELASIDKLAKGLGCSQGERYGMHLCADNVVGGLVRSIQSVLYHWREFEGDAEFGSYIEATFGPIVDE